MAPLISDIDRFLSAHQIGAATFGQLAMNDRHLVRQLRKGRRLWPETEAKVRRFMAEYPSTPTKEKSAA